MRGGTEAKAQPTLSSSRPSSERSPPRTPTRSRGSGVRRIAILALSGMLALSLYGTLAPSAVRCGAPGAVDCPGGVLGPAVVPAGVGEQWFNVVMDDWGFFITDTTTGANESNAWNVFEGYTVHINATSLAADVAIGGEAYHGLGVEINATGQQLLSLAAPVGQWVTATFVAPTAVYHHQHIWCTIPCGPGHGSQYAYVLNVLPATLYPVAKAASSASSGPAPLRVNFTGNGSSGTPPYNYTWSFGDGSALTYGAQASHTYTLGGVYFAALTVTDSKGNQGTTSVTETVLSSAGLSANVTATPPSGLVPLSASFSTVVHGGTPPYNYTWDFGDGTTVPGANATSHVFTASGIYAVAVTVRDSLGATIRGLASVEARPGNGSLTVSVKATPTNGSAPFQPVLSATASGGTAPYDYRWEFGNGATGTGANESPIYNTTGSYVATVFASDAAGRSGGASVVLAATVAGSGGGGGDGDGGNDTVHRTSASPAASGLTVSLLTTPSSGGAPLPVQATASIQGGSGTGETVSWSFGDGATGSGQIVAHTFSLIGTYTLSASVTDSAGNTGSASTVVSVSPLSISIVTNRSEGEAPFALGSGVTVIGGTGLYGPVAWTWGDGTKGGGALTGHTYPGPASGNFTIGASVSDSKGSGASTTTVVTVLPALSARVTVTKLSNGGPPLPVSLRVTMSGGSGVYAPEVLWSFGDQSSTRGPTSTNHTYQKSGHFEVLVYVNDSAGSFANATAWVNISAAGLPSVRSGPSVWVFTGVGNPGQAALIMMGMVGATGLGFLYRRRARKSPSGPKGKPAGSRATSGATRSA